MAPSPITIDVNITLILRFTMTSISNRFQFLFWFDLEFTTALDHFYDSTMVSFPDQGGAGASQAP